MQSRQERHAHRLPVLQRAEQAEQQYKSHQRQVHADCYMFLFALVISAVVGSEAWILAHPTTKLTSFTAWSLHADLEASNVACEAWGGARGCFTFAASCVGLSCMSQGIDHRGLSRVGNACRSTQKSCCELCLCCSCDGLADDLENILQLRLMLLLQNANGAACSHCRCNALPNKCCKASLSAACKICSLLETCIWLLIANLPTVMIIRTSAVGFAARTMDVACCSSSRMLPAFCVLVKTACRPWSCRACCTA